jgi:hypothetical protein
MFLIHKDTKEGHENSNVLPEGPLEKMWQNDDACHVFGDSSSRWLGYNPWGIQGTSRSPQDDQVTNP